MSDYCAPGLKRIDNVPLDLKNEPESFRKVGITVESVCYYEDAEIGRPLSAVLLNVFFDVQRNEEILTSATIPLVVRDVSSLFDLRPGNSPIEGKTTSLPSGNARDSQTGILTPTANSQNLHRSDPPAEIIGSFPSSDEYLRVPISKKLGADSMGFMATPFLGSDSGQREKETSMDAQEAVMISLSPQKRKFEGPTKLTWAFNFPKGALYPNNIHLLVIVCGPGKTKVTNDAESISKSAAVEPAEFGFHLCLQNDLRVKFHSTSGNKLTRVWSRSSTPGTSIVSGDDHAGWYFDIVGPYNPSIAKKALDNARNGGKPSVGLMAAF